MTPAERLARRARLVEPAKNGAPGEGQWLILLVDGDTHAGPPSWRTVMSTVQPDGKEWKAVAILRPDYVYLTGIGVDALDAALGVIEDHRDHVAGNRPILATRGDPRDRPVPRYERWDLEAFMAWLPEGA